MLSASSNNPISSESEMGGQDNCFDLCSGDTSCVAYNYYDTTENPDTCTTFSNISRSSNACFTNLNSKCSK